MTDVRKSIPGDFGARPKAAHNSIFAVWLVEMFGQQRLRETGGVVDIAGGAGGLSYELSVRFGIHCTVIDPREITLNTIMKKRMKKISEKRAAGTTPDERAPDYLKTTIDDGVVLDSVWKAIYSDTGIPFEHIKEKFLLPFPASDSDIRVTLESAAIIVGMHPDSATGDIVDAALLTGKPFAILPCCVFPGMFVEREVDSKQVRSYDDLVLYILSKDSRIQVAELPFVGKNKVLFRI